MNGPEESYDGEPPTEWMPAGRKVSYFVAEFDALNNVTARLSQMLDYESDARNVLATLQDRHPRARIGRDLLLRDVERD
jgi:hypothetical protein